METDQDVIGVHRLPLALLYGGEAHLPTDHNILRNPSLLAGCASLSSSSFRTASERKREMKGSGGADKLERKTVEKNRRIHMKNLCVKLTSLVPKSKVHPHTTTDSLIVLSPISKAYTGLGLAHETHNPHFKIWLYSQRGSFQLCLCWYFTRSNQHNWYSNLLRLSSPWQHCPCSPRTHEDLPLTPPFPSLVQQRATMTQQDLLEQATCYVNELKERVERLKQEKEKTSGVLIGFGQPLVTVRHLGSNLEVNLVCGLRKRSMLHQVIIVLVEEGADVTSASSNIVGDKIFHTFHCQAIYPRIGLDPSRVQHRLKELVRREALIP
ncbi:Polypeptide deformylase [Musa troglodytarum]|uniref:Polypeptide deformylase n=1 Tax=Musa troglodytarum TaxID=320322 RepID=A0A9E7F0E0_9LILI|nr:Polypeptide deformylase [Musa troglodytarum]